MHVILTGATGFIGSAFLVVAQQRSMKIRLVLRSNEQAERYGDAKNSAVVVPEIAADTDWSEALVDVDVVVHYRGSAVMAGAIVGTEVRLGVGSIVNCGAVVDHHATVEDFGHLGVNASMTGGTVLGRGAWMQAGSALGFGVKVGAGEVLLPGSARESKQAG